MTRRTRLATQPLESLALVCGSHPIGDADLIVRLFTEHGGMVAAVARGARRTSRRFASLEPMHLLRVRIELPDVRELGTLVETSVERPRIGLIRSLVTLDAAGQALRWVRASAAPRVAEPDLWAELNRLLDALDSGSAAPHDAGARLATFGMRMLVMSGWSLELERCVRCSKPCPERARVVVHVAAGGVVCRSCGTGELTLSRPVVLAARQRHWLLACARGEGVPPDLMSHATVAIALVDEALRIHSRGDAT